MPFIENSGTKLYYEETGSGGPVVFLHEFAADYRTWEAQVRRFSREYRCVTYNARGYPPSGVPEPDAAYTFEHHRNDLVAVLDALGIEQAHVVGLSMGAYTALQVALSHPGRVRSVVFASGGSGAPRRDRDRFARDALAGADRMLSEGMPAAASGLAAGPTRVQLLNKDPRGWLEFRACLAEHSAIGSALTLRSFQAGRPSLYDLEDQLRVLDVPVLLAVGDEDDPVVEANIFLKRTLPRAGLWIHPQTGHGLNLEEPSAFNRALAEFFAAVERGTWRRRDPRADPAMSVFLSDKERPADAPR
jgi:pimeloyl-ACP methyl ester carboxylesterase